MGFDDLGTIRDAAVGSYGLAWLPCWLIRDDVAAGRLATVLDHLPSHLFDTHALWPQTPHVPLRLRLAVDALASALPETTSLPSTHPSETSASTPGDRKNRPLAFLATLQPAVATLRRADLLLTRTRAKGRVNTQRLLEPLISLERTK